MTLYFILCYLTLFNTKVRKKPRKILQVHEQNMFVIVTVADLTAQNLKVLRLIAQTKNFKDNKYFRCPKNQAMINFTMNFYLALNVLTESTEVACHSVTISSQFF